MSWARRLNKMVEKPYIAKFWGRAYIVKAKLLRRKFGDGNMLLALQPLNTRPHYYVCRIDSKWKDCESWREDDFYELVDELQNAIEEQFDRVDCEDDDGVRLGDTDASSWPVADFSIGCSWFAFGASRGIYRKFKARVKTMATTQRAAAAIRALDGEGL